MYNVYISYVYNSWMMEDIYLYLFQGITNRVCTTIRQMALGLLVCIKLRTISDNFFTILEIMGLVHRVIVTE